MSLLSSLKTNTFTVTVEHNIPAVRTYAARLDSGVLHILVPEHIALDDRHFLQTVLPDELMDAVLIHELCHLREMNHGVGFKSMLKGYVPDIAEKNRRIKGYAPLIRLFV